MASQEEKLLALFRNLNPDGQEQLHAFAEFLQSRHPAASGNSDIPLAEPEHIPAPEGESVHAALRRLRTVYHMIDTGPLLHRASGLVTEHMLRSRPALEVIEELEIMFRDEYHKRIQPPENQ